VYYREVLDIHRGKLVWFVYDLPCWPVPVERERGWGVHELLGGIVFVGDWYDIIGDML
jgi:hypothetical protein